MTQYMDFEKPLAEIEGKAEELRAMARRDPDTDMTAEAKALDVKAAKFSASAKQKIKTASGTAVEC